MLRFKEKKKNYLICNPYSLRIYFYYSWNILEYIKKDTNKISWGGEWNRIFYRTKKQETQTN